MKETSAIFDHLKQIHLEAACAPNVLRASIDAKAPVLIGPFSRGGRSRIGTEGADYDFRPWGKLTPFGIFLPDTKDLSFYFTDSKVTSDFLWIGWSSGGGRNVRSTRRWTRCCWTWTTGRRIRAGGASSYTG